VGKASQPITTLGSQRAQHHGSHQRSGEELAKQQVRTANKADLNGCCFGPLTSALTPGWAWDRHSAGGRKRTEDDGDAAANCHYGVGEPHSPDQMAWGGSDKLERVLLVVGGRAGVTMFEGGLKSDEGREAPKFQARFDSGIEERKAELSVCCRFSQPHSTCADCGSTYH
jgi:hypothetical protein